MAVGQGLRGWLGVVWEIWKTVVKYVPPEYAIAIDLLEVIVDLVPGKRTGTVVAGHTTVQQSTRGDDKRSEHSTPCPEYKESGVTSLGTERTLTSSESEIFRSPPPSYDDFTNDMQLTPSAMSSTSSLVSLSEFAVASALRTSPTFSRARLVRTKSSDPVSEPSTTLPRGLFIPDTSDHRSHSPVTADSPHNPPAPLLLDSTFFVMDSLDVSGQDFNTSAPSTENNTISIEYRPLTPDEADLTVMDTTPRPARTGPATPIRARATPTNTPPTSRPRRRQKNKENLPPLQNVQEPSPAPVLRRTRTAAITANRRNAILLSPRSFRS